MMQAGVSVKTRLSLPQKKRPSLQDYITEVQRRAWTADGTTLGYNHEIEQTRTK